MLLAEWHLPPDYITEHWTDELLSLMIKKLAERRAREVAALRGEGRGDDASTVPAEELFAMMGKKNVRVVRHHAD